MDTVSVHYRFLVNVIVPFRNHSTVFLYIVEYIFLVHDDDVRQNRSGAGTGESKHWRAAPTQPYSSCSTLLQTFCVVVTLRISKALFALDW